MKAVRAVFWLWVGLAVNGGTVSAQGIFTCIDGKGRKLTSDRPIPECVDREQRELNASGSVKRSVGPTLTAQEMAAEEERIRKANLEQAHRNEERRRERVLLGRYPDKASHDRVRAQSLVQIDETIRAANRRIDDLVKQRKGLDQELEFYQGNPAKAPVTLRRQLEENDNHMAAQKRYITDQQAEKNRVNTRFDDELAKLRPMWQVSASIAR